MKKGGRERGRNLMPVNNTERKLEGREGGRKLNYKEKREDLSGSFS